LAVDGVCVKVVSFPSWELFNAQDLKYRESVLPKNIRIRLAVEAGVSQGWDRWVGDSGEIISIDKFGSSGPAKTLFEHYGFTVENVVDKARGMLKV